MQSEYTFRRIATSYHNRKETCFLVRKDRCTNTPDTSSSCTLPLESDVGVPVVGSGWRYQPTQPCFLSTRTVLHSLPRTHAVYKTLQSRRTPSSLASRQENESAKSMLSFVNVLFPKIPPPPKSPNTSVLEGPPFAAAVTAPAPATATTTAAGYRTEYIVRPSVAFGNASSHDRGNLKPTDSLVVIHIVVRVVRVVQ